MYEIQMFVFKTFKANYLLACLNKLCLLTVVPQIILTLLLLAEAFCHTYSKEKFRPEPYPQP